MARDWVWPLVAENTSHTATREINYTNNLLSLKKDTELHKKKSILADTLTSALWNAKQKTQLTCVQSLDPLKLWDENVCYFSC